LQEGKLAVDKPLEPLQDKDGEKWIVPHFDGKGVVQAYMEELKLPATFVRYSMYLENFLGGLKARKQEDGSYVLAMPMADKPTGVIAVDDAGPAVAAIFDHRDEYMGKTIGLANENLTMAEMAAAFSEGTGEKFAYAPLPMEVFAGFGFPGADDLARMMAALYCADPKYCPRSPEETKKLNPALRSVKDWAAANKAGLV